MEASESLEECARRACGSGRQPSVSRVTAGRSIRTGIRTEGIRHTLGYLSTVIVASHDIGSVGSLLTQVRYISSVLVAVMV
jgi:hypothetical protein